MRVDGVSARQVLGRLAAAEHVFPTYRAVVFILVLHAIVRIVHGRGNAHAALGAVLKILLSSHPTEPAFLAVERTLGKGHPYIALFAVIFRERHLAPPALVRFAVLSKAAILADYFLDGESVHGAAVR